MAPGSRTLRFSLLIASVFGSSVISSVALAAEASVPHADVGGDDEKEARGMFMQGQVHYSLGEYAQAIAQFRRAYELTSAPGLLFNVAQAHRLAGQCPQALEVYRHFARLVPESEHRPEAEKHIEALVARCGAPPPLLNRATAQALGATADKAETPALQLSQPVAPPERPRGSLRRRTAAALLGSGVVVGLAAGALYWWNDGRYDDWRDEDRRLATTAPSTSPEEWLAAQQRNDARLRSIQTVDAVDLTLAGVAIAAVVASAVLTVVFDR
jgi:hypothetical protein